MSEPAPPRHRTVLAAPTATSTTRTVAPTAANGTDHGDTTSSGGADGDGAARGGGTGHRDGIDGDADGSGVDGEAGSGVLGASFGIVFFLGFLLLAAQVSASLYARSVVTSAALDAARIVASAAGPDGQVSAAELAAAQTAAAAQVESLLGPQASFEVVALDREQVEVLVSTPGPRLLFGGGTLGRDVVERRVVMRLEQLQ